MSTSPRIESKRFYLATITPDRVSNEWLRWSGDATLMGQMNVQPRRPTRADIQRYIGLAQKHGRAIIGIYDRSGDSHVGLYEAELNQEHRNVTINVLVDQARYEFSAVLKETDPLLLKALAERYRMEKAVARVIETYVPALRHYEETHWTKEGVLRGEHFALDGNRRLDVVQFGKLL